ncbi:MAG: MmcB family DNA repair protein [Alphaproteobacteria bacterium]
MARRLARGVGRLFADLGAESLTEVPLKGGRRADVLAIDRKGRVLIAEIKSGPADFRSDNKWPEYQDWCDVFYFAVAEDFPRALLPDSTGLIIADAFSAAIIREAPEQPLASARRKALTLRFARLAAARWRRLSEELGGPAAPPEKDSATDPC